MSLALVSRKAALLAPWNRNPLWRRARAVPSLDLRFAENKSLVDATTGQNLVTFSRASGATFVDSQGVIRNAVTNLLLRSEEFNDGAWGKTNVSVSPDSSQAPPGATTADTITDSVDGSAAAHAVTTGNVAFTSGLPYAISVYAKAGTYNNFAFIFPNTAFTSSLTARFNISAGTLGSIDAGVTASIIPVGGGWYRCVAIATATASASSGFQLRMGNNGSYFYQGNGTGTIVLWGAQLEQSSTVGEYISTTSTINSAPRFDHNPTTGESLGLLVEEQRTNSIRNNTMVGAVAGTPGTLPTNWPFQAGTNGLAVSIVGTGTESGIAYLDWKISGTTTALATADISFERTAALTGQTWTSSAYVKLVSGSLAAVTTTFIRIVEENSSTNFVAGGSGSIPLPTTAALVGQRGSFSRTLSGGATVAFVRTNLAVTVSSGATVDITLRIGLPQLEQGAFATSVIPTSTAAATRSADVASISGSNYSSWANNNEGTVFSDSSIIASQIKSQAVWELSGGTVLSSLRQPHLTSNQFRAVIGGTFTGSPGTGANLTTGVTRAAVAYSGTAGRLQVGGAGTDATGSALDATSLSIGSIAGSTQLNGRIKRLVFWPQRLSNSVLETITQ